MANAHEEKQYGYLYRRGPIWWGRVRLAGKEHRRSLRTEDREEALKRLEHWRKKIEREIFGMVRVGPSEWVYFVHDLDMKAVKVGVSTKVNRRFHALKCNTPSEVVLLGAIEGTPETEAVLHRYLSPFHRKGEWFQASDVVMAFVAALIELDRVRLSALEAEFNALDQTDTPMAAGDRLTLPATPAENPAPLLSPDLQEPQESAQEPPAAA